MNKRTWILALLGFAFLNIPIYSSAEESILAERPVDQRSYRLGGIGAFAEMVDVGVKRLALSAAMTPKDMDALEDAAKKIAERHNIKMYRETELMVTDLFPAAISKDLHVLIFYKDSVLDEYMALKKQKSKLIASGTYYPVASEEIAKKFGKMLSYPDVKITALIEKNAGQ